jgi:hypothetical protein
MINEFLREKYGERNIPKLSVKTIAKQILTIMGRGTELKNVSRINELYNSKKYYVTFFPKHPCAWDEIVQENGKRKPLIAWVWLSNDDGSRGSGHAVVIRNIDEPRGEIYFNDPSKPEPMFSEDIPKFLSKWSDENVDYALVTFKVEEKNQTHLPDYSKKGD